MNETGQKNNMNKTLKSQIIGHILGITLACPLLAFNYWAGTVALFANHPTYLQILAMTIIGIIPVVITKGFKSLLGHSMKIATFIAFVAWVLRFVGIMPNAPF